MRRKLLLAKHVGYVFYGPQERASGGLDPGLERGLTRVYENTGVTIYQVGK